MARIVGGVQSSGGVARLESLVDFVVVLLGGLEGTLELLGAISVLAVTLGDAFKVFFGDGSDLAHIALLFFFYRNLCTTVAAAEAGDTAGK
jgi:hypothetical protein